MKALILAGGKGTRMGSVTEKIPKPMVKLKGKTIMLRIMEHYSRNGINEFIILAGFKQEVIKEYFINLTSYYNDIVLDYKTNNCNILGTNYMDWKVTVVNTGDETQTGGRISRVKEHLKEEDIFHITYGDGLSDVDPKKVEETLIRNNSILTMTSVHPRAKFGELIKSGDLVTKFEEKPELTQGLINGGFMVASNELFKYIDGDEMLEKEPMQRLIEKNKLSSYSHEGYWKCFDTKKDVLGYKIDEERGSIYSG